MSYRDIYIINKTTYINLKKNQSGGTIIDKPCEVMNKNFEDIEAIEYSFTEEINEELKTFRVYMNVIINYKNKTKENGVCSIVKYRDYEMFLYTLYPPIPKSGLGSWMLYKTIEYIKEKVGIKTSQNISLLTCIDSIEYFKKLGFIYIGKGALNYFDINMSMNIGKLLEKLNDIITNKEKIQLSIDGLSDEELDKIYKEHDEYYKENISYEKERCSIFNNNIEYCKNSDCYYDNNNKICKPTYLFMASQ